MEYNSSLVCVSRERVLAVAEKASKDILEYRKEAREKLIKEYMEPYKSWFRIKQRTREQAEERMVEVAHTYYSDPADREMRDRCYDAYYYREWALNSFVRLIKACRIGCDENIWLSTEDACLIYNEEKRQ